MPARTSKTPVTETTQPRGRPPLDDAERKRILDATTAVFLEKGFDRASTSEIAKRARTSKQTLYALFPTKADLFVSVMSAHTDQLFARHAYYIESGKTPRQALTEIGHSVLEHVQPPEFLALYRIIVAEAHNFPDLARQLWRECTERGYGLLAEYLQVAPHRRPRLQQGRGAVRLVCPRRFRSERRCSTRTAAGANARSMRGVQQAVEDFLRLHPARKLRK